MGRLFVIQYDQTLDSNFYLCRTCQTHIALSQEVVCSYSQNRMVLFEHPPYRIGKSVCVGCNMHLGQKIVEVESPTNLLREGRVGIAKFLK